jgi:hypothetical protein
MPMMLSETMPVEAWRQSRGVGSTGVSRCCLCIGGVSLGLNADLEVEIQMGLELRDFQTDPQECDIEMDIRWASQLHASDTRRPLFDSGAIWKLYGSDEEFTFDFVTPILGGAPYKRLSVDHRFSRAQLCLNREYFRELRGACTLEYPLDELLVTNWLALGRGVEVHGCGLMDGETGGQLFLGHSGAGKSTTARLWKSLREVHVLSDDRIILRREASEVWMHGTPWHGDAGFASPGKARIQRIFVIEHGESNEIRQLSKSGAVAELFARCFVPFHGSEPLSTAIDFLSEIADSIPCYLFRFRPEAGAMETILNFHG